MKKTLAELMPRVVLPRGLESLAVNGVACDSRAIKPGEVFFALPGANSNGLQFVDKAVANGASVVVANQIVDGVASVGVADVRSAYAKAASLWFDEPSKRLCLVGVTGTNGKTTLTYLLEKLLGPQQTGVIGTVSARFGNWTEEASNTTPEPLALNALLKRMIDDGAKAAVMEVSSHALDQKRSVGLEFDACVFTNLTQDHLDYHSSFGEYFAAKKLLFARELAESSKPNRLAVINSGDHFGQKLIDDLRGQNFSLKTYSTQKNVAADLSLVTAQSDLSGTRAVFLENGKEISFKTNLVGEHNVQNIMAALLTATQIGLSVSDGVKLLGDVVVPGRLDRVGSTQFFVDYAHTPDALANVIRALHAVRDPKQSRLIVVFGCGGDRDRAKRPLMGEIAAIGADVVIVTSDNPRTEDPEKIIADILSGVTKSCSAFDGEKGYLAITDRAKALQRAVEVARTQDIVLVAGKGHETYQIIGHQKYPFDDKAILGKLIS